MGRMIALILVLLLLLSACSPSANNHEKPLQFYYPTQEASYTQGASYIQHETREGANLGDDLIVILNAYIKGPVDETAYQNPFQSTTQVISLTSEGQILDVTLSRGFANLSGLRLTTACACLTMTCLSLTDAEYVRIRANGTTLDGAQYIEMSRSNLLLSGTKGA